MTLPKGLRESFIISRLGSVFDVGLWAIGSFGQFLMPVRFDRRIQKSLRAEGVEMLLQTMMVVY